MRERVDIAAAKIAEAAHFLTQTAHRIAAAHLDGDELIGKRLHIDAKLARRESLLDLGLIAGHARYNQDLWVQ